MANKLSAPINERARSRGESGYARRLLRDGERLFSREKQPHTDSYEPGVVIILAPISKITPIHHAYLLERQSHLI